MQKNLLLNYGTLLVGACGIVYLLYLALSNHSVDILTVIGLAITLPSFVLLVVARVQLGRSFSVTPQAIHLVTHGIYSRIRHPIYLFAQLMLLGILLCANYPLLYAVWIILVVLQRLRARKEEMVLEEKFGDEYREYRKSTWF